MPPWRCLLLALALGSGCAMGADNGRVAVIVGAGGTATPLAPDDLAQIYRRKKLFVGTQRVQPVNLPTAHPLRRFVSQQLLQRSPEELDDYWRDMYFNGIFPPFVLASEEAVVRFVAATPGALGYVSQCALDKRVTVVAWLDGGPPCTK